MDKYSRTVFKWRHWKFKYYSNHRLITWNELQILLCNSNAPVYVSALWKWLQVFMSCFCISHRFFCSFLGCFGKEALLVGVRASWVTSSSTAHPSTGLAAPRAEPEPCLLGTSGEQRATRSWSHKASTRCDSAAKKDLFCSLFVAQLAFVES